VKRLNDFGNGGNAAVFVKQGIELWRFGLHRRCFSCHRLWGAGFFAKSRAKAVVEITGTTFRTLRWFCFFRSYPALAANFDGHTLPLEKLTRYYDKNYKNVDLMGCFEVNLFRREICLYLGSVNISLTLTVTQRWQRG
jgi:hypothetical protein